MARTLTFFGVHVVCNHMSLGLSAWNGKHKLLALHSLCRLSCKVLLASVCSASATRLWNASPLDAACWGFALKVLLANDHRLIIMSVKLKLAELDPAVKLVAADIEELESLIQTHGDSLDLARSRYHHARHAWARTCCKSCAARSPNYRSSCCQDWKMWS